MANRSTLVRLAALVTGSALASGCGAAAPKNPAPTGEARTPAGPTPPGSPSAAPTPVDLASLRARELPVLPPMGIDVRAVGYTSEAEAKAPPSVKLDGAAPTLTIPLGTDSPIDCALRRGRIDTAATLAAVLASIPSTVELASGKTVEVALAGESMVVFFEGEYLAHEAKRNVAGLYKIAIQSNAAGSLVCTHDEFGYGETFRRVVKGLVAASSWPKGDEAPPRRRELSVIRSASGQPVGYAEKELRDRDKGGRTMSEIAALIVPRGKTSLALFDVLTVESFDETGVLLSALYLESRNGAEPAKLELTRDSKRQYTAVGTYNGKPVQSTFHPKADLTSTFPQRAKLKALAAKGNGELALITYAPDRNPAAAAETHFRAVGGNALAVEDGGEASTAHVDAEGMFDRYQGPGGDAALVADRVFVKGKP